MEKEAALLAAIKRQREIEALFAADDSDEDDEDALVTKPKVDTPALIAQEQKPVPVVIPKAKEGPTEAPQAVSENKGVGLGHDLGEVVTPVVEGLRGDQVIPVGETGDISESQPAPAPTEPTPAPQEIPPIADVPVAEAGPEPAPTPAPELPPASPGTPAGPESSASEPVSTPAGLEQTKPEPVVELKAEPSPNVAEHTQSLGPEEVSNGAQSTKDDADPVQALEAFANDKDAPPSIGAPPQENTTTSGLTQKDDTEEDANETFELESESVGETPPTNEEDPVQTAVAEQTVGEPAVPANSPPEVHPNPEELQESTDDRPSPPNVVLTIEAPPPDIVLDKCNYSQSWANDALSPLHNDYPSPAVSEVRILRSLEESAALDASSAPSAIPLDTDGTDDHHVEASTHVEPEISGAPGGQEAPQTFLPEVQVTAPETNATDRSLEPTVGDFPSLLNESFQSAGEMVTVSNEIVLIPGPVEEPLPASEAPAAGPVAAANEADVSFSPPASVETLVFAYSAPQPAPAPTEPTPAPQEIPTIADVPVAEAGPEPAPTPAPELPPAAELAPAPTGTAEGPEPPALTPACSPVELESAQRVVTPGTVTRPAQTLPPDHRASERRRSLPRPAVLQAPTVHPAPPVRRASLPRGASTRSQPKPQPAIAPPEAVAEEEEEDVNAPLVCKSVTCVVEEYINVRSHTCSVYKGKMYRFGGIRDTGEIDITLSALDMATHQWQVVERRVPFAREAHSAVVWQGLLLLFGGWGPCGFDRQLRCMEKGRDPAFSGYLNDCAEYDLTSGVWRAWEWTDGGVLPDYRAEHSAVVQDDAMLVWGGWKFTVRESVQQAVAPRYTPPLSKQPQALFEYLAAHATPVRKCVTRTYAMLEEPRTDLSVLHLTAQRWENPQTSGVGPCARIGHTACLWNGNMVVFGGAARTDNGLECLNDLFLLNIRTYGWQPLPPASSTTPAARVHHAACVYRDNLLIVGGIGCRTNAGGVQPLICSHIEQCDLRTGEWTKVEFDCSVPRGRWGHTVTFLHSSPRGLCVVGGTHDLSPLCAIDPVGAALLRVQTDSSRVGIRPTVTYEPCASPARFGQRAACLPVNFIRFASTKRVKPATTIPTTALRQISPAITLPPTKKLADENAMEANVQRLYAQALVLKEREQQRIEKLWLANPTKEPKKKLTTEEQEKLVKRFYGDGLKRKQMQAQQNSIKAEEMFVQQCPVVRRRLGPKRMQRTLERVYQQAVQRHIKELHSLDAEHTPLPRSPRCTLETWQRLTIPRYRSSSPVGRGESYVNPRIDWGALEV